MNGPDGLDMDLKVARRFVSRRRRTRRVLRQLALVASSAVAIVAFSASPAFAHAVLLGTNPPDGTIYPIASPPTSVSMHFGENVGVKLGAVRVYDEHSKLIDTGAPGHPPGDGSTVVASLPKLAPGTYVVTWRVISADTHPVSGAFTFTVGPQQQNVSGLATKLLSSANGSRPVGVAYGIERFLLFASLIALLGGAAFVYLVWRAGRRSRRARLILWAAWIATFLVTALGFAIEGIYAAAYPFSKLLDPTVLSDTLHGRFGETAVARLALLVLTLPVLALLLPRRSRGADAESPARLPRWWAPVALVLAVSLVVTVTLASHGTTGRWTGLAIPADVVHLSSASLWFGGLLMLTVAVLPTADVRTLEQVVPAYSVLAFGAVVAIVVTGVFQATRQVGTMHALFTTTYGHFLLAKVLAVGVLVVFAAFSREVVNRWYVPQRDRRQRANDVAAVGAATLPRSSSGGGVALAERPEPENGAIDDADPDESARERAAYRGLRFTVAAEVVIAVVVLVLTAFLVDTRPAYEVTNGPQIGNFTSSPLDPPVISLNLVVEPAKSGLNQIHLSTETPQGTVANPMQVTMELTNASHNVGPLQVRLTRLAPGHYLTYSYDFPFPGTWQVTVKALMTPVDESIATHNVTIR
jgi:copper transport protein